MVYLRCLWKSWTCPDNIMDVRRGKSNLFGLVQKQTVAPLAYHGDSEDVECYLRASLQCKRRATPAGASIKRSFQQTNSFIYNVIVETLMLQEAVIVNAGPLTNRMHSGSFQCNIRLYIYIYIYIHTHVPHSSRKHAF